MLWIRPPRVFVWHRCGVPGSLLAAGAGGGNAEWEEGAVGKGGLKRGAGINEVLPLSIWVHLKRLLTGVLQFPLVGLRCC